MATRLVVSVSQANAPFSRSSASMASKSSGVRTVT